MLIQGGIRLDNFCMMQHKIAARYQSITVSFVVISIENSWKKLLAAAGH